MSVVPRRAAAAAALTALALAAGARRAAAQPDCVTGTTASYGALAGGCRVGGVTLRIEALHLGPLDLLLTPVARTIGGRSYVGLRAAPTIPFSLVTPNTSDVSAISFGTLFRVLSGDVDAVRINALDAAAAAVEPTTALATVAYHVPSIIGLLGQQRAALAGTPAVTWCFAGLDLETPGGSCTEAEAPYAPLQVGTIAFGLAVAPTGGAVGGSGSAVLNSAELLFRTTATPEPATLALLGTGLLAVFVAARSRRVSAAAWGSGR